MTVNGSLRLTALPLVLYLLANLVWAQSALPWRLGPGPGAVITLPEAATVQGEAVRSGVPTLVFFTLLDGRDNAYEVSALASAWQSRHPDVQILLVDTRTPPDVVRDWVNSASASANVIADEGDDAFENAFDTNRLPIIYLLDEVGVVQDKVVGNSIERFIELDQVLAWAAEGAWDEVSAQRSEWLTLGEMPARVLEGVPLGEGRPVVIYHTHPLCPPCQQIAEGNFQEQLNQLASRYPDARFVILEADISQDFDINVITELGESFISLYGRDALTGTVLLAMERGRVPDAEPVALPSEGWVSNVRHLGYRPTALYDPQRWWSQAVTPGVMLFDSEGSYRGPIPFWEGPYNATDLIAYVAEFLEE